MPLWELCSQSILRDELCEQLSKVYDLQRLMTKVIYGSVNPRELKAAFIHSGSAAKDQGADCAFESFFAERAA